MARFASNKRAFGYSERSGFRYKLKDMRKEWNGLTVGYDEYESKHPQLDPIRVGPDPQALRNPKPRVEFINEKIDRLTEVLENSEESKKSNIQNKIDCLRLLIN